MRDTANYCYVCSAELTPYYCPPTNMPWRRGLAIWAAIICTSLSVIQVQDNPTATLHVLALLSWPAIAVTCWLGCRDANSPTSVARTLIRQAVFATAITSTMPILELAGLELMPGHEVEQEALYLRIIAADYAHAIPAVAGFLPYLGMYYASKWVTTPTKKAWRAVTTTATDDNSP